LLAPPGDIGEWTGVGTLKIIDRKKNIFKLAQGEYVAAEKIENVCMRVPLVAQCFVYGDSLQSYLVGIVVPDAEEVVKWAGAKGVAAPSAEAVVAGAEGGQLAADIQQQMAAACKEAKLQGFEMVKKVALEPEVWSVENGILTPTFKLKRNEAKKKYIEQINAMYAEGVAPTSKL
jgi:long-chain acyl-CoA synthetase